MVRLQEYIKSKTLRLSLMVILCLAALGVVFSAGVFVGLQKAKFSYRWGDNYFRNFAGPGPNQNNTDPRFGNLPPPGFLRNLGFPDDREYIGGHGTSGQILKISNNEIIIQSTDNTEKNILVDNLTVIRKFNQEIKPQDLKTGDGIVVIGSPNDQGQIAAKLIRVLIQP